MHLATSPTNLEKLEIVGRLKIVAGVYPGEERRVVLGANLGLQRKFKKIGNWIDPGLDSATIFLGNEENDSTDGDDFLSVTVGLGMRES